MAPRAGKRTEERRAGPARAVGAPLPARGGVGAALEMPGELVLLLRVALPLGSHRQRMAAVAFAVEDLVAEPIEALHVALGPELARGEYLVAVLRHSDMAEWGARAVAAGRRLVPDTLALPVPPEGAWSVREADGRVLARLPDGTGFATGLDAFETFWRAGNRPQTVLFGGRLPAGLPVAATALPPPAPGETAGFDLLQGRHARTDRGWRRMAPRFAGLAVAALVAHLAVLAGDAHSLGGLGAAREASLRAALAERLGALPDSVPVEVALARALPSPEPEAPRFLPLLARASEALEPLGGEIGFASLAFGAEEGGLAVTIEAGGLGAIQRAERGLTEAGLAVRAGAATTGDGAAEARFVIGGNG